MPLRKKIPSLKDLCMDNIIQNIIFHGRMFERHRDRENDNVCASYKLLQFLFSDDLLQRLFMLLSRKSVHENLRVLQDLVLYSGNVEKQPGCERHWPCLELFFNEHTSVILPHWSLVVKYRTLDRNSDPTKDGNIFRCFMRDRLYDAIPRLQNLREVSLSYLGNSEILKKILEACPLIKYFSAESSDTDLIFLSLCKHHPFQEEFIFCPENGECSKAGKHLEHLHVVLREITVNGAGIACALQHLPLLKSFYPLPPKPVVVAPVVSTLDVFQGILTLQNAANQMGKEWVTLKLSVLFFIGCLKLRELRDVLMSCPDLETIEVNLSGIHPEMFTLGSFKKLKELRFSRVKNETLASTELQQLISAIGKQIEAISFEFSWVYVDLVLINNILNSLPNLKRLRLYCISMEDKYYKDIIPMPSCTAKLEDIFLDIDRIWGPSSRQYHGYFCDLLSNAKSLKRLTISSSVAEQAFLNAVDKTGFQNLQELVFCSDEPGDFPFLRLLDAKNSLRKLKLYDRRESSYVARCIQFVRNNNYDVEF